MVNSVSGGFTIRVVALEEGNLMAKATSHKPATHKKTRARRPNASGSSASGGESAGKASPESEIVGDEAALQAESRAVDENLDDEPGIYGPNRGETAG
jgi:hypothetical protein